MVRLHTISPDSLTDQRSDLDPNDYTPLSDTFSSSPCILIDYWTEITLVHMKGHVITAHNAIVMSTIPTASEIVGVHRNVCIQHPFLALI
jgi:hypothetical protein